jgi:hypothetical protein
MWNICPLPLQLFNHYVRVVGAISASRAGHRNGAMPETPHLQVFFRPNFQIDAGISFLSAA